MTQTQENGKKHFGLDLGLLGPNSRRKFFFCKTNSTVPSYHLRQFKGKLVNQT